MFEKRFEALGREWTLQFTNRAREAIEDDTALGERQVDDVFGKKEKHSAKLWRVLMTHGLRKHHRDITRDQVNDILDSMSSVQIVEMLGDAWVRAGTGKPLEQLLKEATDAAAGGVPLAGLPGGQAIESQAA